MAQFSQNQNTYDNPNINDELVEEEQLAFELGANQELYAAQAEATELYNQGQKFSRPSLVKYSVLASLASIIDLVDLIDFTGIGVAVGRTFSFGAWIIMLLILWFTNTNQKRADEYIKNIEKKAEILAARIASAEKNILTVARLSRKMPGAKQLYRKFHLRAIRRTRIALKNVSKSSKNPIIRSAVSGSLNLVPFLAVIPWMLVGIWLSYRAEKESYKNARDASGSVLEATGETTIV